MPSLKAKCSNCDKVLLIPKLSLAGKRVRCTQCGEPVRVPEVEEPNSRQSKSKTSTERQRLRQSKSKIHARSSKPVEDNIEDDEEMETEESKPRRRSSAKGDGEKRPRRKRGKKQSNSKNLLILSSVGGVILIGTVLGILWATGVFGSSSSDESAQTSQAQDSPPAPNPTPTPTPNPALSPKPQLDPLPARVTEVTPPAHNGLTAANFYNAFYKGSLEDRAKFRGNTVELLGEVNRIEFSTRHPLLHLNEKPDSLGGGVACEIEDPKIWEKIIPPGWVVVRGQWDELAFRPRLINCELVKVESPSPLTIDFEEFAERYRVNPRGTFKRLAGEWALINGTVAEKKNNYLILEAEGGKVPNGMSVEYGRRRSTTSQIAVQDVYAGNESAALWNLISHEREELLGNVALPIREGKR